MSGKGTKKAVQQCPPDLDVERFGWCDIHGRAVLLGIWCGECVVEERREREKWQRRFCGPPKDEQWGWRS